MSSVVISGDTSGAITLSAPAVAGTNTITLPAATGTVAVSGNTPLITVKLSTAQSCSGAAQTVVAFDTELYDTNNCFNTSNYRFTPTVAGWYLVSLSLYISGGSGSNEVQIAIQKNGADYMYPYDAVPTTAYAVGGSGIVYCNGTTDYLTIAVFFAAGRSLNATWTTMSASLLRTA